MVNKPGIALLTASGGINNTLNVDNGIALPGVSWRVVQRKCDEYGILDKTYVQRMACP